MNSSTTKSVPWHGGPGDRTIEGLLVDRPLYDRGLPVLVILTDDGATRSVPCFGISRSAAMAAEIGTRIRIHDAASGIRTITAVAP